MPDTQFVYIADIEGDFYDIYHEAKHAFCNSPADWVIRATFDRAILDTAHPKKRGRLKSTVKASDSVGKVTFAVSSFGNRKKREVTQDVFTKQITLLPLVRRKKMALNQFK